MATNSIRAYPSAAYYLTLLGGVIIAFAGVVIFFAGITFSLFFGSIGNIVLLFSFLGVLVGLLLIGCAVLLRRPNRSTGAIGALIILLAILSIPFTFGGFGIGFIVAIVGGLLALMWKPIPQGPLYTYANPVGASPSGPTLRRVCPACGTLNSPGSTYCSKCGKPLA